MSDSISLRPFLYLVGFLLFAVPSFSYSQLVCQIECGRVNEIRLGDSIEKVFAAFGKDFVVSEVKPKRPLDPQMLNVTHKSSQKTWFVFTGDANKKIVFADVTGPCLTRERIGVGSTFGQVMKVYGRPILGPTDVGYVVGFEKLSGGA